MPRTKKTASVPISHEAGLMSLTGPPVQYHWLV